MKQRLVGSWKCNKNSCQVSKNVVETDIFHSFLDKKFITTVIGSHVLIKVLSTSCCVRCVVGNITVKLMTNSDTSGIIIRITVGKV